MTIKGITSRLPWFMAVLLCGYRARLQTLHAKPGSSPCSIFAKSVPWADRLRKHHRVRLKQNMPEDLQNDCKHYGYGQGVMRMRASWHICLGARSKAHEHEPIGIQHARRAEAANRADAGQAG